MFGNLTTNGLEKTEDRLGGFSVFDSDAYDAKIKVAYGGQADSGAKFVQLVADINGREYRETIYVTNRAGENFFLNKQDNTKKVPLPGFTIIDHICLATTGKSLAEQPIEDKVVQIYDYDAKKELPKSVPVLTELTGQNVTLGILKNLENKSEKRGNEYVATAETRDTNNIDKVFDTNSKMTVTEALNNETEAKFYAAWVQKNKGQTRDKREIKDGQAASAKSGSGSGSAPQASGSAAPRKSLFGG